MWGTEVTAAEAVGIAVGLLTIAGSIAGSVRWACRRVIADREQIRAEGRKRYDQLHRESLERHEAMRAEMMRVEAKVDQIDESTVKKEAFERTMQGIQRSLDRQERTLERHHTETRESLEAVVKRIDDLYGARRRDDGD